MPAVMSGVGNLKSNTFLSFLDSLLPYLRLDLVVVKDALVMYNLKVSTRKKYGDTLHLASGTVDDILKYFPGKESTVQPLALQLSAIPFGAQHRTVLLLDVLIVLTLLTKGSLREKSLLLYSFFALAEPEGMLEYEHAGLIQKVGSCLKKINAIRPLDLTADDARYLADLARRNEEEGRYHRSLNFSKFFDWITHSPETSPAFQFIRLLNRLFHIAMTLDAKIDSVKAMLHDVTNPADNSIGVPKFSSNDLLLQEKIPQIVFCSSRGVSFLLPSLKTYGADVYVHIEKPQIAPFPLFEMSSKDLTKKHASVASDSCCTKVYHNVTRQLVSGRHHGHSESPFFQVTVSHLEPGVDYILTLYTAEVRFSPVKIRSPDLPPMLPQGGEEVKLVIFPASMGVEETVKMAKDPECKLLASSSVQMIYTGVICPIKEAVFQMLSRADCFPLQHTDSEVDTPLCPPMHFANVSLAVVDGYYSCHWQEQENILFSLTNTAVSEEGLLNEASCLRNVMTFSCSPWDSPLLERRLMERLPPAHFSSIDQILSLKYSRQAAASAPPASSWEMGFTKVFFLQPPCVGPPSRVKGQVHASSLPTITSSFTKNSLSNNCNHIILLLRTPADLMKHSFLWGEEDCADESTLEAVEPPEKKAVRRGKHEILYGAHSATPDVTAQSHHVKSVPGSEVRKGGDSLFNKVLRSLHQWLTAAPAGGRRVTLVSCRWSAGVDFSLCIDGDAANFISHVSLEPTGTNPQCTSMLHRITQSFNALVTVETGPPVAVRRAVVFDVVCSDGCPSACQFEPVPPVNDTVVPPITSAIQKKLVLNGNPKISYLSNDEACVVMTTSGCGYVCCTLYEVPCVVGFADVHRIIETELSSLFMLKKICNRVVGKFVEAKFTFRDLSPFCAYCVTITTSDDDPMNLPDSSEPPVSSDGGALSAPPFIHFRTLNKRDNSVSTFLLAGVLEGDLSCASSAAVRVRDQLDGNGRPLAAPVYLLHHSINRLPGAVMTSGGCELSQSQRYSEEVQDLFRMTMTVHIGNQELAFKHGRVDLAARAQYELQNGSVHLSSNGRFVRIALTTDTTKSFHDLVNCIRTIRWMKKVTNISVFVVKPLVHHLENRIVGSTKWEKSKHFDKKNYFPAVVRALAALKEWRREEGGRDVQIMSIANVAYTLVTYFHSAGMRNSPETGFRHFTLPLYIHQKEDAETFSIPCGTFNMDSLLCYTTFTYNKGTRSSDLRSGTPFQLIQPHFHLHGYSDPRNAKKTQNVLYKVSVFTDDTDHTVESSSLHHVTVKSVLDDVDNMELLLGPVVGQVTSSTVNIVFEINRQADSLVCILRPVGNPTKLKEIKHLALPFQPVVYQFEDLEPDHVYDILMPELHGDTIIGKFRSLSSKAFFSEILFLGDEHLENFPIANQLVDELMSQQVVNFEQLRAISYVRKYEKDSREAAGVEASLDKDDPAYRRPWVCLSERMKGLACTTSTVFHLGSHALLSRLLRLIIPPLVKTVKKYNIDLEKYEKSSAVSKFYQMQLNQIIEDSLRLVWIVEPVLKDVFSNCSNIPLYNSEYWLSESTVWGTELGMDFSDRDVLALEKIRKLFAKNLENFIYPLKSWRKNAKNHFHVWREGTVAVITLDQTSEQAKLANKQAVSAANSAMGRIEEEAEEEEKEVSSKKKMAKKKKSDNAMDVEDEVKAKTFDASFMSEHQWKQIRAVLMEKNIKQLVICMQFPMIPLEVADSEDNTQPPSEFGSNLSWVPREEDKVKFFGQMLKWIMPKKGKRSGKTLSFVCVSNKSFLTNIQDMKSGMKIQQMCLGKFSCVNEANSPSEEVPPSQQYIMTGKVGGWKYQHRLMGLDEININSDYCGNGGLYAGRMAETPHPHSAVFGILKFWFDTWKPTGVWNFKKIPAVGSPDMLPGDAVVLVGPVIGAPRTHYIEDDRAATTMTVPILLEVDRPVTVICVATDLFNGTQVVVKQDLFKHRPTIFRLTNLNIDTRYTVDFVEGVQNAAASRFIVQTNCSWDDTNVMLFNMEQRGAQGPVINDSSYMKMMSDRLRIPFHGINCSVHVNCHVDVSAIFDEVQFMPELKELLNKAKSSSIDDIIRSETIQKLRRMVLKIMDRVRLEYRLYFSRPSYRELLMRGFHLFMGRDTYKDAESADTDPAGSLMALLRLISSRVNQEYFDQMVAEEDEVYSAWPRIEYTEEMLKQKRAKEELKRQEQQQLEEGEELLVDENNPDGSRLLTLDDYLDKHILNVPLMRRPFRTFFDNAQNPVDCVLFQWMQNFVPPPVLWKPYVFPNQRVTIESFCQCDDRHIRDIHERIVNSDVHEGARLIIMPSFGPLLNTQSLLGYKLSQWTRRWVKEGQGRTITLVAPSKDMEGSYNYSMSYGVWPDPVQYAQAKPQDIPPPLEGTLSIQTLHSIFMSNEKEMARIKKEKVEAIKEKTKSTSKSRGAVAKQKKEEASLKEQLKVELQEIFQSLTPDGFVLYENRAGVTPAPVSAGGGDLTISYTEVKTVGTKLDKSISGEVTDTTPRPYDYLNIPAWLPKFIPASAGVFVQDEVNIVIRQEPLSRKALDIIEMDEEIVQQCKKIYLSSRLSELSRPEDMREYDMEVEGIKEMFLEEIVAKVWREALPNEVKSRMFTLTDDYIRTVCVRRAFTDVEKDLSSPLNFCKAVRRMLLANVQIFLAFKMSKMERWKYILETDEFPEDSDKPYLSEDDDSDIEAKDDETELTTKDDETETKMSESIVDMPSIMESGADQNEGSLALRSEDVAEEREKGGIEDEATVEGLFGRSLDNASGAPPKDEEEQKGEVVEEAIEKEGGVEETEKDQATDLKVGEEGEKEENKSVEEGKETEGGSEIQEVTEEVAQEGVVENGSTHPEDLPPTDSERVALTQVDILFALNWRRLEKRREVGEQLAFMTTHHLS